VRASSAAASASGAPSALSPLAAAWPVVSFIPAVSLPSRACPAPSAASPVAQPRRYPLSSSTRCLGARRSEPGVRPARPGPSFLRALVRCPSSGVASELRLSLHSFVSPPLSDHSPLKPRRARQSVAGRSRRCSWSSSLALFPATCRSLSGTPFDRIVLRAMFVPPPYKQPMFDTRASDRPTDHRPPLAAAQKSDAVRL